MPRTCPFYMFCECLRAICCLLVPLRGLISYRFHFPPFKQIVHFLWNATFACTTKIQVVRYGCQELLHGHHIFRGPPIYFHTSYVNVASISSFLREKKQVFKDFVVFLRHHNCSSIETPFRFPCVTKALDRKLSANVTAMS